MAKQRPHVEQPHPHQSHELSQFGARLELVIAIALGLAAIVTAGSVYLNEKEEHKATLDFHHATSRLIEAVEVGPRTERGHELEAAAERELNEAEDQQEKATRYTLIEVVVASSLFLFGVAGVGRSRSVKVGALGAGAFVFLASLALLATA